MLLRKWLGILFLLLAGMFCTVPVHAENSESGFPLITMWKDGHGYQEDGTQITGGWGYDSVNPAGKYVLFGEDGTVLRKAERREESNISNDYTGTELVPATIALRAEVFEGFHGTITVLLEEKSGIQKTVELSDHNFFGLNIRVNSGEYVLREVEAEKEGHFYAAEFPAGSVHIPEREMRIMKIRVTDKELETAEHSTKEKDSGSEVSQTEQETEQKTEKAEGEEESEVHDLGIRKVLALAGGIGTACLAGIWLLRKKRKKYRGS